MGLSCCLKPAIRRLGGRRRIKANTSLELVVGNNVAVVYHEIGIPQNRSYGHKNDIKA